MRTRKESAETPSPASRILLSRRVALFAFLAVVYAIYTVLTVHHTWVPELDKRLYDLRIKPELVQRHLFWPVYDYVTLGQRGPATLVFLPYFLWTAHRMRSSRPLVMLLVALVLLNLSVGAVKLATGRIGPHESTDVYRVFAGGNIYPSGHVSNAVVLYGLIAMISLRHRKLFTAAAVWIAVSVGAGTVMIDTHWFSDVIGGWFAGGLVLLALPWFVPPVERVVDRNWAKLKGWYRARRGTLPPEDAETASVEATSSPASSPVSSPVTSRQVITAPRPLARRARSEAGDTGQLDSASP